MSLDPATFEATCRAVCPNCAAGKAVRFRPETREWVHDLSAGRGLFSHTLCMATHLRNSDMAPSS